MRGNGNDGHEDRRLPEKLVELLPLPDALNADLLQRWERRGPCDNPLICLSLGHLLGIAVNQNQVSPRGQSSPADSIIVPPLLLQSVRGGGVVVAHEDGPVLFDVLVVEVSQPLLLQIVTLGLFQLSWRRGVLVAVDVINDQCSGGVHSNQGAGCIAPTGKGVVQAKFAAPLVVGHTGILNPVAVISPPPLLVFDDLGEDEFPRLVVFDDVRYFRRPPLLGGGVIQADNQVRLLRVKANLVRHENDRKGGGLGRPPERLNDQSPTVRLRLEDVLDPLASMEGRRKSLYERIERLVSLGRIYSRQGHHKGQFG